MVYSVWAKYVGSVAATRVAYVCGYGRALFSPGILFLAEDTFVL